MAKRTEIIIALLILFPTCLGLFSPAAEPSTSLATVSENPSQTKMDWTLDISTLGISTRMEKITPQGNTLPVPDYNAGYYQPNSEHIFIVGHNNTIFKDLNKLPNELSIYKSGESTTYRLIRSEVKPVEDISMNKIFSFDGVVLMTCAGEKVGNTYSHRLILYYES